MNKQADRIKDLLLGYARTGLNEVEFEILKGFVEGPQYQVALQKILPGGETLANELERLLAGSDAGLLSEDEQEILLGHVELLVYWKYLQKELPEELVRAEQMETLLLKKILEDLTPEENAALEQAVEQPGPWKELYEQFADRGELARQFREVEAFMKEEAGPEPDLVMAEPQVSGRGRNILFTLKISLLVVFICLLSWKIYLHYYPNPVKNGITGVADSTPIVTTPEPGYSHGTLLLADGTTVLLDTVSDSMQRKQADVAVSEWKGQLSYTSSPTGNRGELLYNTLIVPYGGQYRLQLEDGTKVWLNAGSSIRYPVAFGEKDRSVELTGEAYFEVASDPSRHFVVNVLQHHATSMVVQALGTSFNINAYEDEPLVQTTLVEGQLDVAVPASESSFWQSVVLKPGEQASLDQGRKLTTGRPDRSMEAVTAWKNNRFVFERTAADEVFRQVARWYDLLLVFKQHPNGHFTGELDRNASLPGVLKILELSGLDFELQGRTLIVGH